MSQQPTVTTSSTQMTDATFMLDRRAGMDAGSQRCALCADPGLRDGDPHHGGSNGPVIVRTCCRSVKWRCRELACQAPHSHS